MSRLTLSLEVKGEAKGVINTSNHSKQGLKVTVLCDFFTRILPVIFQGFFFLRRVLSIANSYTYQLHRTRPPVRPSVRPRGTTRLPIDGLS